MTWFRQAIKDDAVAIRAGKPAVRSLQRAGDAEAPAAQSTLDRRRLAARLRLLLYVMARGRTWGEVEANHPAGVEELRYLLAQVWGEAQAAVARETGHRPEEPAELLAHAPWAAR